MTARVRYSSLRCEICDLPPLYDVNFGDGWTVVYWPGRAEWLQLPFAAARDGPPPIGHKIYTCGSAVCVFRARHHGVPGAQYATS